MSEQKVSVADAKKNLSELLGKVAYGKEQIIITKRGRPMARLVPAEGSAGHLGDVKGWLDDNDPFFDTIGTIVEKRASHIPRILKQKMDK